MLQGGDCFQAALFCGDLCTGLGLESQMEPFYGLKRGHPNLKQERNTARYNNGEWQPLRQL
jgi:hypothetical protein